MKELILHVGPAKTGTTAIQGMLARSRSALAKTGVCYPVAPEDGGLEGQPSLAWEILERLGRPVVRLSASSLTWEQAQRQALDIGAHKLLVSAEDFSLDDFDDVALKLLSDLSGAQNVVIVYGLRDPARLMPSMWQQAVKWGLGRGEAVQDFDEALPALIERYRRSAAFYLGRSLAVLPSAKLRPFIVPAARGPELHRRFWAAADLNRDCFDGGDGHHGANESIGYAQLRLLLELNRSAPICVEPLDKDALLAREFVLRQLQAIAPSSSAIPIGPELQSQFADLRGYWRSLVEGLAVTGDTSDLTSTTIEQPAEGDVVLSANEVLTGALRQAARQARETSAYAVEVAAARDWWRGQADETAERLVKLG